MKAPPAGMRRLYTRGEVAALLRVEPTTVTRWAKAGKLPGEAVVSTPGRERRYDAAYIDGLVNGGDAA